MHALTLFFRKAVFAFVATGLPLFAAGEDNAATPVESIRQITLEEALRIAVENNLSLASGSYARLIARESVRIADSEYQPVFFARLAQNFSQSQATSQLEGTTDPQFEGIRGTASVSQKINTGAVLTFTGGTGRNESNSSFEESLYFDANAGVSIVQPLLRGAGTGTNRILREQANIGADRSDLAFKGQVLDIIQLTEIAFYNIAFAQENLDVRQAGVDAAEQFVRENEARQRAGLATELDVMQSRVGLATRRAALISAQQLLRDTTDNLLSLLGDTTFSGLVRPTNVDFSNPDSLSVGRSYGLARENDTAIVDAEALLRQLELGTKLAANNKRPLLDLGAGYGLTNVDDGYGSAIGGLPEDNGYNWQVNLVLSVPWGLTEGRARLRQAEYNVDQQRAYLAELDQNLMVQVRAAVRAVETDVESAEITHLATELSGQEYQLEKARFDSGLSTSRLVVDAQQRENLSRVLETEAKVRLKQNEARLRRVEGSSLYHYALEIPQEE